MGRRYEGRLLWAAGAEHAARHGAYLGFVNYGSSIGTFADQETAQVL